MVGALHPDLSVRSDLFLPDGYDFLQSVGILSQHMAEGALSSGMRADQIFSFKNSEEAAEEISPLLQEGDLILVKSSRKIEIEKIVERLKKDRQ